LVESIWPRVKKLRIPVKEVEVTEKAPVEALATPTAPIIEAPPAPVTTKAEEAVKEEKAPAIPAPSMLDRIIRTIKQLLYIIIIASLLPSNAKTAEMLQEFFHAPQVSQGELSAGGQKTLKTVATDERISLPGDVWNQTYGDLVSRAEQKAAVPFDYDHHIVQLWTLGYIYTLNYGLKKMPSFHTFVDYFKLKQKRPFDSIEKVRLEAEIFRRIIREA